MAPPEPDPFAAGSSPPGLPPVAFCGLRERLTPRAIGRFAAIAILAAILLSIPWPGVRHAYARAYCGIAQVLFGRVGAGQVRFIPIDPLPWNSSFDTQIRFRRDGTNAAGTVEHSARLIGYLPTVNLIALILATPATWRWRRRALLIGLAVMHVIIVLRLGVNVLYWFGADQSIALYTPGPALKAILHSAQELLVFSPALSFIAPALVWGGIALPLVTREAAATR